MIHKIIEGTLTTDFGEFIERIYTDGKDSAICISFGDVVHQSELLVRIHSSCISSHVFYGTGCDCRRQMRRSQERIVSSGAGVIIYLEQEGRSNGHAAKIESEHWKRLGHSQSEAYLACGYPADNRNYSVAIKILREFSPKSVRALTGNAHKVAALELLGVAVTTELI